MTRLSPRDARESISPNDRSVLLTSLSYEDIEAPISWQVMSLPTPNKRSSDRSYAWIPVVVFQALDPGGGIDPKCRSLIDGLRPQVTDAEAYDGVQDDSQNSRIKEKRDYAVHQNRATLDRRGDIDVAYGVGQAHGEGDIHKVHVVGLLIAGEVKNPGAFHQGKGGPGHPCRHNTAGHSAVQRRRTGDTRT
jgi:hypothetical protein